MPGITRVAFAARYCCKAAAYLIVIGDSNPDMVSLRISESIFYADGCIGMIGMAVHINPTEALHRKI